MGSVSEIRNFHCGSFLVKVRQKGFDVSATQSHCCGYGERRCQMSEMLPLAAANRVDREAGGESAQELGAQVGRDGSTADVYGNAGESFGYRSC